MGILETRHGIITKSVLLLLYVRSANESSREYKSFRLIYLWELTGKRIMFVPGTGPHVSFVSGAECPVYN